MKKIKVSFIGCGRIFKKHLSAIRANKSYFEIDAICDKNLKNIQKHNISKHIKIFKTINSLLKSSNSDIYVILTPSGFHYDHILQVGKFKKNILTEKPMVMNYDQCVELKKFLNKGKINLYVVKQNRFNPAIKKLKEAMVKKRFGKVFLATIRVRWKRDDSYFKLDNWRGSWKLDGGVLANQASHHIDLLVWLMGDVKSVYAKASRINKITKATDTVAAIIKFKNGATGIIETTTATEPSDLEGSISILGQKGSVEIGGFAASKVVTWKFAKTVKSDLWINNHSLNNKNVYGTGHIELYKEIYNSLTGKKNNAIKYSDSIRTIKLIDKIYAAAEKKIEIKFDDNILSKKLGR
jgi:UDP-N-acetyl-2-amino-2-deoxyglucuronate dehydrogenase